MNKKHLLVLTLVAMMGFNAFASDKNLKKEMTVFLDGVAQVYSSMYAPALWKKQFSQWTLEAELDKAKTKVQESESITIKGFQKIVRDFILSMKDYHVSVKFYATEKASLPFMVRGSDDRYFFVYIDRDKLPKESFPFEVGDELVKFNGEDVHSEVQKLKATLGGNTSETDQALAEMMLTSRSAESGVDVPKGAISIIVKKGEKQVEHQLIWEYQKEQVSEAPFEPKNFATSFIGNLDMSSDVAMSFNTKNENPFQIGGRTSYLPALGKKIWTAAEDSHFDAYIYLNKKKELIGYVRIPKYGAGEKESKEFLQIIKKFQEVTDKMVIDQLNNPGGSVFYLYSLVSMLTDKAVSTPKHYMAITQAEVLSAVTNLEQLEKVKTLDDLKKLIGGETIGGYPASMTFAEFMKDYYRFLIDEWNAGKKLTAPHHLYGVDQINPHPEVSYTKPILLLINELDFSGGDFFPAILQDNKRVTILGTRTAGAGGYVLGQTIPNQFGVKTFRVTGSLADRVDHTPIENLGVTPDIEYTLTPSDYQNKFKDYATKINEVLESL